MELIITVLALLAAVYAVTPRERQLDLRLRIGTIDWLVIVTGFLLVICLEFRDFRIARGWFLTTRGLPAGITATNSMYLVLLAVAAFVGFRIRFSRLTKRKIYKFRELVEELYWAESYGELFTLIQQHLKEIFRIYDSEFFLSRLRSRLDRLALPAIDFEFLKRLEEIKELKLPEASTARTRPVRKHLSDRLRSLARPLVPSVVKFLPKYDTAQQTARELIRGIFLS